MTHFGHLECRTADWLTAPSPNVETKVPHLWRRRLKRRSRTGAMVTRGGKTTNDAPFDLLHAHRGRSPFGRTGHARWCGNYTSQKL